MAHRIILILLVGWSCYRLLAYRPDDLLHIVFCDVGQGDATLIRHKSVQLLVDGGKDSTVLDCLRRHMPPWDLTLEVVVATHADADHINGLVPVLDNYEVKSLLHNGLNKQTTDFDRFKSAAENERFQGSRVLVAHQGMKIHINNSVDISVLYPPQLTSRQTVLNIKRSETILSDAEKSIAEAEINHNDNSIVLKIDYGELDVLLMGDLEEAGEVALIEEGLITEVEVLKVGHHGSKTSSTPEFIRLSRPEISIVSVGKNNSYGHPHSLVLERLSQVESKILRTDQESSIELVSNGNSLWRK